MPKVLDELIDKVDWEDYKPPIYRNEWGRIIRSPIKNKGHIIMDMCLPSGTIQRTTFSKANLVSVPSIFTALRRATWGGLFPVLIDETEDSYFSPVMKKQRGFSEAYQSRSREERKELDSERVAAKAKKQKSFQNVLKVTRRNPLPISEEAKFTEISGSMLEELEPEKPVRKRLSIRERRRRESGPEANSASNGRHDLTTAPFSGCGRGANLSPPTTDAYLQPNGHCKKTNGRAGRTGPTGRGRG